MPRRSYSTHAAEKAQADHIENINDTEETVDRRELYHASGQASNLLDGIPKRELYAQVQTFCEENNLMEHLEIMQVGALVAQRPQEFESIKELDEGALEALRHEQEHKWSHPAAMYLTIILCSIGACVQGWDQTGTAGANLTFPAEFGIPITDSTNPDFIRNNWIVGLVNCSPFLIALVCAIFMADPLNHYIGRRGTLFVSSIFCILAPLGCAFTQNWHQLLVCRLLLGFGFGFKEVTAPVLAAENAPTRIRGALVMSWQLWTAFGIFLGYCANLAVYKVEKIAWRLMLASALIPALPLAALVFFVPESPRWLIKRGRMTQAWKSMVKLRHHEILAARDLYYIYIQYIEEECTIGKSGYVKRFAELFYKPRLRQASLAAFIVMLAQQMCGINIIAFFSSSIFQEVTGSVTKSLWSSFGFGLCNFAFAIPAIFTIDTFGRRALLLFTFPQMFWSLLGAGLCYLISDDQIRLATVALFVYLFTAFYSPGEGPVPFTYSAEVFPLSHREVGMGLAVATCNLFLSALTLTFFRLEAALTVPGAFGFYAGLNVLAFIFIFLWVPETKQYSLEELDQVFSIPTHTFTKYQCTEWLPFFCRRYILQDKKAVLIPLLEYGYAHGGEGIHSYARNSATPAMASKRVGSHYSEEKQIESMSSLHEESIK